MSKSLFVSTLIRTIRGRGYNGRNFTAEDVNREYCPTNAVSFSSAPDYVYTFNDVGEINNTYNGEWELDTDNLQGCFGYDDPYFSARPVFATCKNTCPGGETETHVNFVIQTLYFSELSGGVRWEDMTIILLILSIYV